MTNENDLREILADAFQLLKNQHAEISNLREQLKILREAMRRTGEGVFEAALMAATADLRRLKILPDADSAFQEYDELIQRLKAG